jgi:RNA polymerase sigma factor (sigma-70 family)
MKIKAEDYFNLVKHISIKHWGNKYNKKLQITDTEIYSDGLLGLSYAINTFNVELKNSFSTYAYTCIENKIIDGIRKRNNSKHKGENFFYLDHCENDDFLDEKSFFETSDLAFIREILGKEEYSLIKDKYINGKSIDEISKELNITRQGVHQRIKSLLFKIKNEILKKE